MIYDISQPVFSCEVYPGDPKPERVTLSSIGNGALYNLTAFSMCAHNGTHVDAPRHFLADGPGIGELPPEKFVGPVYVAEAEGSLTAQDAESILKKAELSLRGPVRRLLIKGNVTVSPEAAERFAAVGLELLGNESQTVGPEDAPMAVHLALLRRGTVLLEGVRLAAVPEGTYLLNCMPLNLGDADGAPCRAILTDPE